MSRARCWSSVPPHAQPWSLFVPLLATLLSVAAMTPSTATAAAATTPASALGAELTADDASDLGMDGLSGDDFDQILTEEREHPKPVVIASPTPTPTPQALRGAPLGSAAAAVPSDTPPASQPTPGPTGQGSLSPGTVGRIVVRGPQLTFATGSAMLGVSSGEFLDRLARLLKNAGADVELVVTGFADERGGPELNTALAQRRARTVVDALKARGIETKRVKTETRVPLASDSDYRPASDALSRRVDVRVEGKLPAETLERLARIVEQK